MASPLILLGSARAGGNTHLAAERLRAALTPAVQILDLAALSIAPYRYEGPSTDDGFPAVVEAMLAHDALIFATPVYWYAMSGVMKNFFDRLTDLLSGDGKMHGRALRGRSVWLLATGTDDALPPGFHEPFARTAAYFEMAWRGACYLRSWKGAPPDEVELTRLVDFAAKIAA